MDLPLVYVVILNWNLKEETAECVNSVLRSDYSPFRVLIVDNGSTDGSVEFFRSEFPDLEIIANQENLGCAAGNDVGIEHALCRDADYVLLLNNDAIIDRGSLREMVAVGESEIEIGILAPLILRHNNQDKIWYLGHREHRLLPIPRGLTKGQVNKCQFASAIIVDYVSGCAMLVKRGVFEGIGLLDPTYFMYYEDADFCRRARTAGFKIAVVPSAKAWHKVSLSARKAGASSRYLRAKNRVRFYRQHRHGPHPLLTTTYLWINALLIATNHLLRGQIDLARAYLRGIADGYREPLGR